MREALQKLVSVYRKYGFSGFVRRLAAWLRANVLDALHPAALLRPRRCRRLIRQMLAEESARVILWRSSFGWQVPLFQRPQHIARELSRSGSLVIYEVSRMTDGCVTLRRQGERLWLFNFGNRPLRRLLLRELRRDARPKYLQLYSTDWMLSVRELERARAKGFQLIYEYVDHISPVLSGTGTLPKNVSEKYRYAMRHRDVYVAVTAERLRLDVLARRGARRLILSSNGVDYTFFQGGDPAFRPDPDFRAVQERGLPILCYYGALAAWFDYELLKTIARTGRYSVVLFGIRYDDSFDRSVRGEEGIFFLGARPYERLRDYARLCDLMLIPFLLNDVTRATSPVKLFEYMALHKPIVTTDMDECRRYASVLIGRDPEDFLAKIELGLRLRDDPGYLALLDREARANDWREKARAISDALERDE
ncbi:MAG: glycosyltransferase [Oscillospiraceae bacterium]|nr:glycosyltransferase [Oscillospiraceae bacterium]